MKGQIDMWMFTVMCIIAFQITLLLLFYYYSNVLLLNNLITLFVTSSVGGICSIPHYISINIFAP